MRKIWRDINIRRIYYFFLSVGMISFIIYYNTDYTLEKNEIILSFIIAIYSIFIMFNTLRTKLTYISNQGIRIGNALNDKYDAFKSLKKAEFIPWGVIDSIKIFRREIHRPFHNVLISYVLIKTKDNKKYESFIANPKGFIQALKTLKKTHLISKDSKYT